MKLPEEFKTRMKKMLGDEYSDFEKAFEAEGEYSGMRITRPGAEKPVTGLLPEIKKVKWCENGYYATKSAISGKHPYHAAGLVYFQEPSAMLPVSVLPIEKGDYVLDLCAAPGGKTTQAAEKLAGSGLLVANEVIAGRAEILAENVDRCGGKNVVVTNEACEKLAERFPGFFDKIIVDAPCSGEGMFRKEPRAVTEWSIPHTLSCAARQKHIIDNAVKMLRPGGMLVYSTCTFSEEENERVADYALTEYPELSLEKISAEGVSDGISDYTKRNMEYAKRIFPHKADGEGHFAALFRKSGESGERKAGKFNSPPELFEVFAKESLTGKINGYFHTFGEKLYLLPDKISFDKMRVLRPGLYVGDLKKGRFEPSYALAHAYGAEMFAKTLDLPAESELLKKYMLGEVIPCEENGWVCVLADGFPLGWGKAGGGMLKNRYPKKMRL